MIFVSDLNGDGVGSVGSLASLPANKAAVQAPTRASRSLSSNARKMPWESFFEVIELCKSDNEASEARRRRGQAGACREGVDRRDVDVILWPILFLHDHSASGVDTVFCKATNFLETSFTPRVDLDFSAIEPETIARKGLRSRNRCYRVQIRLIEQYYDIRMIFWCPTWSNVTLTEEFIGVFSLTSPFPQYLMTATGRKFHYIARRRNQDGLLFVGDV